VGQSRDEAWRGKKLMLHGRRLINYHLKPGKKITNGECLEIELYFPAIQMKIWPQIDPTY